MGFDFHTLKQASYHSRRSPVFAKHGMVASSQPLASEVGLRILRAGGNAVDAAIAIAAALNVTEPCSTGLGGDCFLLYHDASTKTVHALNGSGRAPAKITLEKVKADLAKAGSSAESLPSSSIHCVTVPGTAAGWADAIEKWGTMSLSEVLEPAAQLAEEGFPVAPLTAYFWERGVKQLKTGPHFAELLIEEKDVQGVATFRAPRAGELFSNPTLAATLRELGVGGKEAFYKGRVAQAIVKVVSDLGGLMEMEDLAIHHTTFPEPIHIRYKDFDIVEVPPNGQGIAALMALNTIQDAHMHNEGPNAETYPHMSTKYLHLLIEAMRLAFADARAYVADPDVVPVPMKGMLDPKYAAERRKLIDPTKASRDFEAGSPEYGSDTVSFQVVDQWGNAVSMVNSNYEGFGSGIIPQGCGFTLQNRGANFSLEAGHPNVLAPNKRPYHTIIPALILHHDTKELYSTFTSMGGFAQPQSHLQLVVNMLDYGMDPQAAIDVPRFCITDGTSNGAVALEEGIEEQVVEELEAMGHRVLVLDHSKLVHGQNRALFGRSQIIIRDRVSGVLAAGSDGRADGLAIGY